MSNALNEHLRARANALFAMHETLKSSDLAIHTRIAKPRLQLLLDGVALGTLEEWERIFTYFQVHPFDSPIPGEKEGWTASQAKEAPGWQSECGTKHRYMDLHCTKPLGHSGDHYAGHFEWDNPDSGPTLLQRVNTLEAAVEGRLSTVEKQLRTVATTVGKIKRHFRALADT